MNCLLWGAQAWPLYNIISRILYPHFGGIANLIECQSFICGCFDSLFLIEAILLMVSNNGHRNSHIDNYHNGWINNGWFYGLLVGQREISYKCCSYILYLRHVGLLTCLFPADKLTTYTVV